LPEQWTEVQPGYPPITEDPVRIIERDSDLERCGDNWQDLQCGVASNRDENMWNVRILSICAALALTWAACEESPTPFQQKDGKAGAEAGVQMDVGGSADGPVTKPDGPVTKPDGQVTQPDGPVTTPDALANWVKIVSPANNATVKNPVTFTVSASATVAKVELFANPTTMFSLGAAFDPKLKTTLTYKFNYTSYKRHIVLLGYDSSKTQIAKDEIYINITNSSTSQDKGQFFAQMKQTYYYLANEADHSGSANTNIVDSSCKKIATVSSSFYTALCIEGSGKLNDGRVINYAKKCSCASPCGYKSAKICYSVLNKSKYPWGAGSKSKSLVPFRSWAVDTSLVAHGTVLYAKEWDGAKIPKIGSIGGFNHDGCFRADDVGGGIKGKHFDYFAGTKAMYKALSKGGLASGKYLTVHKNAGKCKYLASP